MTMKKLLCKRTSIKNKPRCAYTYCAPESKLRNITRECGGGGGGGGGGKSTWK